MINSAAWFTVEIYTAHDNAHVGTLHTTADTLVDGLQETADGYGCTIVAFHRARQTGARVKEITVRPREREYTLADEYEAAIVGE